MDSDPATAPGRPTRIPETEATRHDDVREQLAAARHVLTRVAGARSPIVLFDEEVLKAQVELWRRHLGLVEPHFAIKSCNVPAVLGHFDALGISFDAATAGEIRLLEDLGVAPERVIATHPVRDEEDLRAIARYKPRGLVVDGTAELRKLRDAGIPGPAYAPELLVRIELPFGGLSGKYGATVAQPIAGPDGTARWQITSGVVRRILDEARKIERESGFLFAAFGLCSHVGTNSTSVDKYRILLHVFAHLATRLAERGFDVSVFDLGGGYCDSEAPKRVGTTQAEVMARLGEIVAEFAARHPRARLIAEPGRFLVSNAGSVVIGVMKAEERRHLLAPDGTSREVAHLKVQMNDGLYGNLLGERHDDQDWRFVPLRAGDGARPFSTASLPAVLHGKTCDSWDQMQRMRSMPRDLAAGDHLVVPHAGAYTVVTATDFNSAPRAQVGLYRRTPAGGFTCALYDAAGRPVVADTDAPAERPAPEGADDDEDGLKSGVITLSGVLGRDALRVDRGLLRPRGVVGDARWQSELALVYRNDITLRLADVEPLAKDGDVFEARAQRAGIPHPVVVRIGAVPRDRDAADRFRAACDALRALPADPRCTRLLECGILPEGGNAYCIEPSVAGRTLEDLGRALLRAADGEPLDWRAGARRAFLERLESAALALDAAHRAGVAHRDVRPRNLAAPDGAGARIVLRNWGVFRAAAEGASPARSTAASIPPDAELARAADVAALGAILYAATTLPGSPDSSPSETPVLHAVRGESDPLLVRVSANVRDEDLARMVIRAVGAGPRGSRSALEFAGDLREYLARGSS